MPIYEVGDPAGRILQVEGASPPNPMQIKALFEQYDAEQGEDPFADERTFGGQVFETAKAIPRGFAGSFLTAGEGLAELADAGTNLIGLEDLIDSGEDNAMVSLARDGRAALQESMGADEAYRDTWMTKFGEGLGSFASFFTPAAALKVAGATGKLASLGQLGGAGALAVGSGAGDQAQRIQAARDQGIEISEGDEDLAIGLGGLVGASELAAPTRLLSRLSKNVDLKTKIKIGERLKGALGTGVVEGVQEAVAGILQDATERGIYNENLARSDSMFDDFTIGGAVGTFADLALNGAAGRRRQMGADAQSEAQKNAKEILEIERESLAQEVSSAQVVYEQELAARQGLAPSTASEVDLGEIEAPRRGELAGAAGSSGAYLNVVDREGNEFQAEEKISFKKGREERYVRRVNDDGTFTNVVLSRDGVPVEGISSEIVLPAPENIPSRRSKDPMLQYARRIRQLAGDKFLSAGNFSVEEKTAPDGTRIFEVVAGGIRYGKPFAGNQREEAISLAGNLNEQLSDAEVAQRINTAIDNSGLDLSPEERSTMFAYGWKALNTDQNTYTSAELNQAGGTTVIDGFNEQLSNEEINNTAPSKLTMSQRINKKRMAKGKAPTNSFTVEEVKDVLGAKFGNIRTGEIETETYAAKKGPDGNPVVVTSSGEVIAGHITGIKKKKSKSDEFEVKPFVNMFDASLYAKKRNEDRNITSVDESVFANKNIRIPELNRLLDSKNIVTEVGSPEFRVLMEAFTGVKASGSKRINDLSNAEMKILYQKIRSLPQFADPTPLVNFLPTKAPVIEAVQEEVVPDDQPPLLLPQKTLGDEKLEVIQKALDERMDKTGLGDIRATISRTLQNVLRNAEGELVFGIRQRAAGEVGGESFGGSASLILDDAPPSDAQAFYSTPTGEIFLGLDKIDSTLSIEQQVDAALDLLSHEQVHAMREANLFTDKEWAILTKATENAKSDQVPDQTFLRVASENYRDLTDEGKIEEAVAELVRAARRNPKIISGKPKNLLSRIPELFARLKGFLSGSGYTTFEGLIADIESGAVGARERGGRISQEAAQIVAGRTSEGQRMPDFIPEMLDPEDPNSEVQVVATQPESDVQSGAAQNKFSRRSVDVTGQGRDRDRGRGREDRRFEALAGTPNVEGKGPIPELVGIAESYAERNGIPYQRQPEYVKVDPERATRIAEAYENMPHAPQDPEVQEAYQDLISQTKDQYDVLIDNGYSFTFFDGETDPYGGNPFNAMRDLRYNKNMAVYGTYDGYGTEGVTGAAIEDNPMLADTGLLWKDQQGIDHPVTANDLFRAVHDAFGHGIEGSGFRARGEENAWLSHSKLFTGPALKAITSETRGQNSWVNYGPYGEANQTAKLEDTVFAEQKTGLMPSFTWTDGALPPMERERADGSVVGGDPDIQKVTRDAGAVQKVVDKNEQDAVETPADHVPRFSFTADPEAQYIAQNPEEGITPSPILTDKFSRRNSPELAPEAQSVVSRVSAKPETDATPGETYLEAAQTFKGKLSHYLTKLKQEAINNYARLEVLNRDPAFKQNLADTSSIAAALFADRSMGIVASALKSGVAVYQDGMTRVVDFVYINKSGVRKKYKGLVDVMAPLYSNEYNVSLEELAQAYAIAKRADRLRKLGLPVPTKAGDLAVLEAEIAKFKNEDGVPIIEEWYDTWQAYNNKTVEFMKATGIVDDALAQKWMEMSDYIPFYRQADAVEGETVDLGKNVPQMFKRNMTTAVKLKKLKGSEKAVNVPMLDAITRNLSMAIDSGMKNVAQQRIVRDMIQIGLAEKATPEQRRNKTQNYIVSFKVDGVDQHYSIKDPLIYESMQTIGAPLMGTSLVGGPSKLLREMITRDPGFMFANMMRDTLSAYVTSGANFIPVIDTVKNINLNFEELERFGVVGGYDFSNDPEDIVRAFGDYSKERGVDVDGKGDSIGIFKKLWNWSGNATTASDAATRKAVYYDVLARTGNEAEAAFQALEVINFSRRGRNPGVRLLTTAIPFLNARFQGLDVLYRGFMGHNSADKEKSRRQATATALMRGSIITATTMAYWLMFSDDEEYKKATDEQRDLNWILPLPKSFGVDVPLRIPVPFEVGLLFKTIPERILDTYGVAEVFGKTGQTSQRELGESLTRGIGETLALNPLGAQIVAPLIEAVWNKNFYTGRDIVPFYLSQNSSQGLIARASNTELAKLIGKSDLPIIGNTSPMKIDHVMRGYVGTIGGYIIDVVDEMIFKNPAVLGDKGTAAPTKDFTQLPVMKRFFLNKFSSGDVQDFYDLRAEVKELSGDLKRLAEEDRLDEYEAVFRARGHLLAMKDTLNYTGRRLSELRKQRQIVERSDLSSDLKRDMIDEIQNEIEAAVRFTPMLKREANLPVRKNIGL